MLNWHKIKKERIPNIRFAKDMKEVILDKEWVEKHKKQPLYYMYEGVAENTADAEKIKKSNLRFDILDSAQIFLSEEYNKTAGHYHSKCGFGNYTYPELYEVISGEAYYLIQKIDGDDIVDIYAVKAQSGDKVLIPPNYGHFTIFLSKENVQMSNWASESLVSNYEPVKQKRGACYYALREKNSKDGIHWVKNKNYKSVPSLRFLPPTNFEDIGLVKNINMYNLVKDLNKLDYLNNPQNYSKLWGRVLNN